MTPTNPAGPPLQHHAAARQVQHLDPEKERAAAQRATHEMRTAAIVITTCVGISIIVSVLILALGHFGL